MYQPRIVFFSSVTNNTTTFVEKIGFPHERIPLRPRDPELFVDYPYVLVVPTYGGGEWKNAVPKQVIKFLNVKENRDNCVGVIASGNTNFGEGYGIAGEVVSSKLKVPMLYRFELRGFDRDVKMIQEKLPKFFENVAEEVLKSKNINDEKFDKEQDR